MMNGATRELAIIKDSLDCLITLISLNDIVLCISNDTMTCIRPNIERRKRHVLAKQRDNLFRSSENRCRAEHILLVVV